MHDLEKDIRLWKSQLIRQGVDPENVEELESHLHDVIEELVHAGHSDKEAFEEATRRIGETREVADEYRKNERPLLADRIAISVLGALTLLSTGRIGHFIRERAGEVDTADTSLILHVTALTAAFLGLAFFFFLGSYCIGRRLATGQRQGALARMVRHALKFVAPIGAGLVVIGMVAGSVWSAEHRGVAWSWEAREVAPLFVLLWYLGGIAVARKGGLDLRGLTVLVLSGGLMAHFCWFVLGGMPFTTVSVMAASLLALVFVAAFFAFRHPGAPTALAA